MKHTNLQQQEQHSAKGGGICIRETWRSDFPLRAGWHVTSACWKACTVQKKTKCNATCFLLYKFFHVGG